jgi:hypothetical protein
LERHKIQQSHSIIGKSALQEKNTESLYKPCRKV